MYERIAASFLRTLSITVTSPADIKFARYCAGIRSVSIAAKRLLTFSASFPVFFRASTTGDKGGMYQTIGIVRYSGWSGRATLYSFANLYTGEFFAASSQSSGIPSFLA